MQTPLPPLRKGQGTQNNFRYVSEHFKTKFFFLERTFFFVENVLQIFSKIVKKNWKIIWNVPKIVFLKSGEKKLENVFIWFLKNKKISYIKFCFSS